MKAFIALALCALSFAGQGVPAQGYPSRPVRLIVPLAAGGGADVLARVVASRLHERLGKPVVLDNRPGGDTTIGVNLAARAAPDGHTLLLIYSIHAVHPSIKRKLPYDIVKDFAPIIRLAEAPSVVSTNPALPVTSISQLTNLARERPGKLTFAGSGVGGSSHLAAELFNTLAGVRMLHVPFKGSGPGLIAVMGGHVDLMFATMLASMPHVRSGRLRAIATTGAKRSPLLPDLPTVAESGIKDYEFVTWYGLLAPAGTPPAIVAKLHGEIGAIIANREVVQIYADQGAQVNGDGPKEFGAYLRSEIKQWARIAREANLPVED